MKRFLCALLCGIGILLPYAYAADQATPDEAKAMAVKAAEFLRTSGPAVAFPAFAAKEGPWHDRDLYVIVQDSKGVMVAHGTNAGLIGRSVLELRDVEGRAFNHDAQAINDAGWISYKWQHPATKAVEPKTMYLVRVGEFLVGVGAYAPH